MNVLRSTTKLLKRLKQPAKPPEPVPQANLLRTGGMPTSTSGIDSHSLQ